MTSREIVIWLSSLNGIGRGTMSFIENYCGSFEKFWNSKISDLSIEKLPANRRKKIKLIYEQKNKHEEYKYFEELKKHQVKVTTIFDEDYPKKLKSIPDYPYVLYYKGSLDFSKKTLAVIGARKATYYGLWAAEKFSREIAQSGTIIVSGLAKGIDSVAHKAALDANKITFAVLGNGLDIVYPKSNEQLYKRIEKSGAIISEYPLGMVAKPENFPRRNRIISGLCDAVLVIEAKEKSGTLITVNFALEQGKDVLALPGNINSLYSMGTNQLIKDGAQLVTSSKDILENLYGTYDSIQSEEINIILTKQEQCVYNIIKNGPIHLDMIQYETGYVISDLNSILTLLEIKGIIVKLPGNIFQFKD